MYVLVLAVINIQLIDQLRYPLVLQYKEIKVGNWLVRVLLQTPDQNSLDNFGPL